MYKYIIRALLCYAMVFIVPPISFYMAYKIAEIPEREQGSLTDFIVSLGLFSLFLVFVVVGEIILFLLIVMVSFI